METDLNLRTFLLSAHQIISEKIHLGTVKMDCAFYGTLSKKQSSNCKPSVLTSLRDSVYANVSILKPFTRS